MHGKDLRFLANTTKISRTDYHAAGFGVSKLSLVMRGPDLVAFYRGVYSQGRRWLQPEVGVTPDLSVTVNAAQLEALSGVFGDETPVTVALTGELLGLKAKDRMVNLKILGPMEPEALQPLVLENPVATCKINAEKLAAEVTLASEFTAKSMAKPILTGVKLTLDSTAQQVGIVAFDGLATLFSTTLPALITGDIKAIVPVYDLSLGLTLCGSGEVEVGLTETHLCLVGPQADYRVATLYGKFPDFEPIMAQREYAHTLTMDATQVRSAAQAAKVLDAAQELEIVARQGMLTLRTSETSAGRFGVQLKQDTGHEGLFSYDVATLRSATLLGEKVELCIADDLRTATLIRADDRRMWIMQRLHTSVQTGEPVQKTT